VVDSESAPREITAIARIKIPNTTAITMPLDDPAPELFVDLEVFVELLVGFGVVEIVETEDLPDPLTGTDGIE
jgi:hypothetical protein